MKKLKILGCAALIAAAVVLCGGTKDEYYTEYRTHIVTDGQTVWGIATKYIVEQDRTRDVRELVSDIIKYNGIKNAVIQPGQVIVVPLEIKKEPAKIAGK
jgi:LysM repeat protein